MYFPYILKKSEKNGLPHHQNMVECKKSLLAEFANNSCVQELQDEIYAHLYIYQGLLYHRMCKQDFLCSWPSLNSYLK